MKLTQEQLDLLNKPLPAEALSPHPTKPYLTTIKAIFVIERLNEVFGHGGWHVKNEVLSAEDGVVIMKAVFTAEPGIEIEGFGGNDNKDLGDAYKGAATDALTKIGSYLGIGADIWKGQKEGQPKVKRQSAYNSPEKEVEGTPQERAAEFTEIQRAIADATDSEQLRPYAERIKNSRLQTVKQKKYLVTLLTEKVHALNVVNADPAIDQLTEDITIEDIQL